MLFLLTEHHCRYTLTGSKNLLKSYLLIQLQKVIIRFEKPTNSISEQTHGKKAATALSISSSQGERMLSLWRVWGAVLRTHLWGNVHSWLQVGAISWTHLHMPMGVREPLICSRHWGHSCTWGSLRGGGVKNHTYKTSCIFCEHPLTGARHSQSSSFTTNNYRFGLTYRNIRNSLP